MTGAGPKPAVAVIGLGHMGSALADALLAHGCRVTVWNRTPAKAEAKSSAGCRVAPSVAEAARSSDVVIVCLFDHAATREAVMTEDVAGALRGRTMIELTSTRSDDIARVRAWAEAHGARFLAGAIMGYPDDIRNRDGRIVFAGPRTVFDDARPVLAAFNDPPIHGGDDATQGSPIELAYFAFLYPAMIGFLHGAAICVRSGAPVEPFADFLLPMFKSPMLRRKFEELARAAARRHYDENVQATIDAWNDGLAQFIDACKEVGLGPGLLKDTKALLDRAAAMGHGGHDLAAVVEVLLADGTTT
jgi:3-hydroxyisobutyrate dehydrogenase-like beta-hydroxyacid dehydrogenase